MTLIASDGQTSYAYETSFFMHTRKNTSKGDGKKINISWE